MYSCLQFLSPHGTESANATVQEAVLVALCRQAGQMHVVVQTLYESWSSQCIGRRNYLFVTKASCLNSVTVSVPKISVAAI